jgi:hypothetical protein
VTLNQKARECPYINQRDRLLQRSATEQNNRDVKQTLLREARQHLECADALNPEGVVAQAFIHKVRPVIGC